MTMDIIDKRIYSCNEAIYKNIESLQANGNEVCCLRTFYRNCVIFWNVFF